MLGSAGFMAVVALFEKGDLPGAIYDLAPILLSSALAMLLPGQTRRVLFSMKGPHATQSQ
jgi:hypothetical protein